MPNITTNHAITYTNRILLKNIFCVDDETLFFKYDKNQIAKIIHDVKNVIEKRDHTN